LKSSVQHVAILTSAPSSGSGETPVTDSTIGAWDDIVLHIQISADIQPIWKKMLHSNRL